MIPLSDWVASGSCPWTLGTARIYARRALRGLPGYAHLPFIQTRPGGRIFVDGPKMAQKLWKK
jgi:hypothetical protein